jgi:hypothetical protein
MPRPTFVPDDEQRAILDEMARLSGERVRIEARTDELIKQAGTLKVPIDHPQDHLPAPRKADEVTAMRSTGSDPCDCAETCEHGDRCLGGHASSPAAHWYACDICTPKNAMYKLANGKYLMVLHGCGHALGPGGHRELAVAGIDHREQCTGMIPAILNWAADEVDAQDVAHGDSSYVDDLTDHIRCFSDQPTRRSIVPWPELVPRPRP